MNNIPNEDHVFLVNKPLGFTSFNVVSKIRNTLQIKKVGHAGTLDPLATGLLIICTGKKTKLINDLIKKDKEYTGTITLGATTPSFDLELAPENFKNFSEITLPQIEKVVCHFRGKISQVPPIYSAIKKDGQRAYKMARAGIEIKLDERQITVFEFIIEKYTAPVIYFKINCSTGTYIRSIANDIGNALECGGYLSSLCRTKIGEFYLQDALTISQIKKFTFKVIKKFVPLIG